MQGAGNDFVVLDAREREFTASAAAIGGLCDRHFGIGCDQLLVILPARTAGSVLAFDIWNTDGSKARQCGNGARCVAAWARAQGLVEGDHAVLDSPSGALCVRYTEGTIEVDMGAAQFAHAAVPYQPGQGELIEHAGQRWAFTPVSMGNPHAVIFVDDVGQAPVEALGRLLQADARFPDRCNVEFVQQLDADSFRMRVFERGVGETLACGSGACAAAAVAWALGKSAAASLRMQLPGGLLSVRRSAAAPPALWLGGPATTVFEGAIAL
jgi:diaminopimelate epimerase